MSRMIMYRVFIAIEPKLNAYSFLVLNYDEVDFRSFNSGSIDVRTKIVLSVIWQIVAFKDNLSKYCLIELV